MTYRKTPPYRRLAFPLALLMVAGISYPVAPVLAQGKTSVQGRIVTDLPAETVTGVTVVLLRFRLDPNGKPAGGPVGRQKAGPGGSYRFEGVEPDTKAVFQLGARVEGRLVSSAPFTVPDTKTGITMDLVVPGKVRGFAGLVVTRALLVLGPGVGELEVTEVLHLRNPGAHLLNGSEVPLRLELPPKAQNVVLMRPEPTQTKHQRVGSALLLYTDIPPGAETVALRYFLPAALGEVTLGKAYAMPLTELRVMAPQGTLSVTGEGVERLPPEKLDQISYDVWKGLGQPAGGRFEIRVGGLRPRGEIFLVPLLAFLFVMGGVVWWFVRRRLGTAPAGYGAG